MPPLLKNLCCLACSIIPVGSYAQLVVNNNPTPVQLANTIVGAGYDVKNVVLNCPGNAIGSFDGTASNIGIANGVFLTTGDIQKAPGPNQQTSAGFNNGSPGDNDLDNLSGATTYDACVLEFDLVPYCDTLRINYVFASEEYPEFVGREFNDVFAFYVSGPGIAGLQNIALVPGTPLPVTINNINANTNNQFYVNNQNGNTVEYDGFTTKLEGKATVIPCETYHLKIAIADVSDGIFDSGIFIEGNSLQCTPFVYNEVATNVDGVEGCTDGSFTFCRTGGITTPLTVHYTVQGSATNGVDYMAIPDSVVIPAGQQCATVIITPLSDNDNETQEEIEVLYQRGACPVNDTIRLLINDPATIDAGPDVEMCSGDQVKIGALLDPTYTYSWTPVTGLSNPAIPNPNINLTISTNVKTTFTYVLTAVSPEGCELKDSIRIAVNPPPEGTFDAQPVCTNTPATFGNVVTTTGGAITKWLWDFGDNFFDTVPDPAHTYSLPGTYTITLTVTDEFGCEGEIINTVEVWSLPKMNFAVNEPCVGDTSFFENLTTLADPNDYIDAATWDFGDQSPTMTGNNVTHIYNQQGTYFVTLTVVSGNGCANTITRPVTIQPAPKANFLTRSVCLNDSAKFFNQSTLLTGGSWVWDFGDGSTSDVLNPLHQYADTGSQTIKLVVTSYFGCVDSIEKQLQVFPLPEARFFIDSAEGCAPLCLDFEDNSTANGSNVNAWTWLFGGDIVTGGQVQYCFEDAGEFSPGLTVTTDKGCSDTMYMQNMVTVYQPPEARFFTDPSVVTEIQPFVQINDASEGGVLWIWDFGDGTYDTTDVNRNPIHTYNTPGTYTIMQKVINEYGCVDTFLSNVIVREVSTVYIPNAFTPNKDGINDGFIPKATGEYVDADFQMFILDRWGNTIYESKSLHDPWDGYIYSNRGRQGRRVVQKDVYLYIVRFFRPGTKDLLKELRGSVTVVK